MVKIEMGRAGIEQMVGYMKAAFYEKTKGLLEEEYVEWLHKNVDINKDYKVTEHMKYYDDFFEDHCEQFIT